MPNFENPHLSNEKKPNSMEKIKTIFQELEVLKYDLQIQTELLKKMESDGDNSLRNMVRTSVDKNFLPERILQELYKTKGKKMTPEEAGKKMDELAQKMEQAGFDFSEKLKDGDEPVIDRETIGNFEAMDGALRGLIGITNEDADIEYSPDNQKMSLRFHPSIKNIAYEATVNLSVKSDVYEKFEDDLAASDEKKEEVANKMQSLEEKMGVLKEGIWAEMEKTKLTDVLREKYAKQLKKDR
jgi:hypothetical protein